MTDDKKEKNLTEELDQKEDQDLLQEQAMFKRNGPLNTGLTWHTCLSGIIIKFFFPGEVQKNMKNASRSMIKQQTVKFSKK